MWGQRFPPTKYTSEPYARTWWLLWPIMTGTEVSWQSTTQVQIRQDILKKPRDSKKAKYSILAPLFWNNVLSIEWVQMQIYIRFSLSFVDTNVLVSPWVHLDPAQHEKFFCFFFFTSSTVICCGFFLVTNVRIANRCGQKCLLDAINVNIGVQMRLPIP